MYGFLSVARSADGQMVVDSHGSQIPVEELERAAHRYLAEARGVGEMHERLGVGVVIESCVLTREKQAALPPRGIPEGHVHEGWFVGFRVDDPETWDKVKRGELRAFSIGGTARRLPVALRKNAGAEPPRPHQLVDLVLEEGSLVDEPANPLCTVVLWKRREETPMFQRLRNAFASLVRKQDAAPPSTAEVMATRDLIEQWWKLRDAYESAMSALLNSEQSAAAVVDGMLKSTREFADGFEAMVKGLPMPAQKMASVESLEAALLAFIASVEAGGDMKAAVGDLRATLDKNAPGPKPEAKKPEDEKPAEKAEDKPEEEKPADAKKPASPPAPGAKEAPAGPAGQPASEEPAPPKPEEEEAKAVDEKVKKRLADVEAERAVLAKKAADAEAETVTLRKQLAEEEVRRDAGSFLGVPGLTRNEVEQVLCSIRGTEADALIRKSFSAALVLVKGRTAPVLRDAQGDPPSDADAWDAAVNDVMRSKGVGRNDAVRIAMKSHKHAFEQSARASIRPQ